MADNLPRAVRLFALNHPAIHRAAGRLMPLPAHEFQRAYLGKGVGTFQLLENFPDLGFIAGLETPGAQPAHESLSLRYRTRFSTVPTRSRSVSGIVICPAS